MRRLAVLTCVLNTALSLCLVIVFLTCTGLTQGERMALDALEHLDAPYVFHTRGPDRFDCSGLILYCAARQGLGEMPHAAKELYELGRPVSRSALLPGDMVCFDTVRDSDPCDHVGIYLGGNRFVHASSSKRKVVVSELTDYYLEKYSGARRIACVYF